MQRPLGITVTAVLMVANIVCDVILSLTAPGIRDTVVTPRGPSQVMIYIHIALVAFLLVQFGLVFLYWLGKAWARWAVLVGCLYYLQGLRNVVREWNLRHEIAELTVAAATLSIYLLWYLHTERVRLWFALPKTESA